jgi:plastocyanin
MSRTDVRTRSVLVGLCAVALVACGPSGSSSSSSSTAESSSSSSSSASASSSDAGNAAATITISGFQFSTPDSVSPGATITVDNKDGTEHTVTSDDGSSFDDSASDGTTTFTAPTKPGSYPFHCTLHPQMHGTLVVT